MKIEVWCNGVRVFNSELDASIDVQADGVSLFTVTQTPQFQSGLEGGRIVQTIDTVAVVTGQATPILDESAAPPPPQWWVDAQAAAGPPV